MKKLTFLILNFFICINVFAQKPTTGDNQIVLGIQTNNNGFVLLRHYYKDDMAKRFRILGGINYSRNNNGTGTVGYENTSYTYNNNIGLSYGWQKSFSGFEKFEPYIGLDLGLRTDFSGSYYKSLVVDSAAFQYTNQHNGDFNISKSKQGLNLRILISPLVGFNYYIHKNLAVGIEYQFNVASVGYTFSGTNFNESRVQGVTKESHETRTKAGYNGAFNFNGYGGITVSYMLR
jgi:hypothetical protein